MATVPEGYVELDLVGFTDKGTYSSSETYVKNDLVHNDNKIYLSLQDDNIGQALPSSTETENTYWKVWLAGSADDLANITVKDTSNVTGGGANKVVVAQNLIDAIANKVIQNMNSITQLNSKFPADESYFTAVIPRVKDITSGSDQPTLRMDVEYMIQTKGIKSGEYGFSSTQYIDLPTGYSKWGYIKYFQHADNYVTVMVFPDGLSGDVLIRQFILGRGQWETGWKKLGLTEVS